MATAVSPSRFRDLIGTVFTKSPSSWLGSMSGAWRVNQCHAVIKSVPETLRHKSSNSSCRSISFVAGSGSRSF